MFFIYLVSYRCNGHAIIFTFNLNSFRVHALTYIVLPSSPFLSTAVKLIYMYADVGKNKIKLIDRCNAGRDNKSR